MKKLLFIFSVLFLMSCESKTLKDNIQQLKIEKTSEIMLVGEVDSIKVYRIQRGATLIYFTNKGSIAVY